jgi:hypothetical protein
LDEQTAFERFAREVNAGGASSLAQCVHALCAPYALEDGLASWMMQTWKQPMPNDARRVWLAMIFQALVWAKKEARRTGMRIIPGAWVQEVFDHFFAESDTPPRPDHRPAIRLRRKAERQARKRQRR